MTQADRLRQVANDSLVDYCTDCKYPVYHIFRRKIKDEQHAIYIYTTSNDILHKTALEKIQNKLKHDKRENE